MSKYPDNPYWDQKRDVPETPYAQGDWDDAEEGGFLTAEHVIERLERMITHALGLEPEAAAYDDEGFFLSLVGAGKRQDDITLNVNTLDHNPPHCHVDVKGENHKKPRINLETGEFMDEIPKKLQPKRKKIEKMFQRYSDPLMTLWKDYHSDQDAKSGDSSLSKGESLTSDTLN